VPAGAIVVEGSALGANLALEIAAARPELAGVVLNRRSPRRSMQSSAYPRSRLVPAHLLVRDRFDADQAATALRIPSLWLLAPSGAKGALDPSEHPSGYDRITARKTRSGLRPPMCWMNISRTNTRAGLGHLPKRTPTN